MLVVVGLHTQENPLHASFHDIVVAQAVCLQVVDQVVHQVVAPVPHEEPQIEEEIIHQIVEVYEIVDREVADQHNDARKGGRQHQT